MAISAPSPLASDARATTPLTDRSGHPSGPRPLGRRRNLPGSRAVVGGLLVTLAAIGTFVAYTSASAAPTSTVVVANRPIAAGEHLDASDLRVVPADLPDDVSATLFTSPAELQGAVTLGPLATDQAVARNAVSLGPPSELGRTHDLSFALERDRALNGRIQPGELVDLVATFGSGPDARTEIVVRRARVAALDAPVGSSTGASSKVTITLALTTEDEILRAANALEVAKVTLSRSTGTADDPRDPGAMSPTERPPGSTVDSEARSTPASASTEPSDGDEDTDGDTDGGAGELGGTP